MREEFITHAWGDRRARDRYVRLIIDAELNYAADSFVRRVVGVRDAPACDRDERPDRSLGIVVIPLGGR